MKTRLGLLLALLLISAPTAGQDFLPPEALEQGARANAALECAVLAALGPDYLDEQAVRLAEYGHALALQYANAFLEAHRPSESDTLGPMAPFLAARESEFWAGMSFAAANAKVTDFIDRELPYEPGMAFDLWQANRMVEAEAEFSRRNCRFIGQ